MITLFAAIHKIGSLFAFIKIDSSQLYLYAMLQIRLQQERENLLPVKFVLGKVRHEQLEKPTKNGISLLSCHRHGLAVFGSRGGTALLRLPRIQRLTGHQARGRLFQKPLQRRFSRKPQHPHGCICHQGNVCKMPSRQRRVYILPPRWCYQGFIPN